MTASEILLVALADASNMEVTRSVGLGSSSTNSSSYPISKFSAFVDLSVVYRSFVARVLG